ncbi:MAG: class D beta-lactamase [Chitinophagales bacterium]|nr:class D beta-lactamase [Chitinophagales bacterium]
MFFLLSSCTPPIGDHHPEWKKYFDEFNVTGCIEIYDLKESAFTDYNPDRCAQRFIPASTFNILNSLVALETKVVFDEHYVIELDSIKRDIPAGKYDQDMEEAFKNSTAWYYQEVARRVGLSKMQQYLHLLHYGNMQTGSIIDSFWLNGDLRISCDEQIEFLKNFYTYQFPVTKRSVDIVKKIVLQKHTSGYSISGETGWGKESGKNIGWYIGYVVKDTGVYFFALNIESSEKQPKNFAEVRSTITMDILKDLKILP